MSSQEEEGGFNTSDEEFERQLEEAAVIQEVIAEVQPKKKGRGFKRGKGRGKGGKKTKLTSRFPLDGDGYEVRVRALLVT